MGPKVKKHASGGGQSKYSPETKAAVIAALLAGQAVTEVAAEWKIPKRTVGSWRTQQIKEARGAQFITEENVPEIGDLLVGYLRSLLVTLEIQQGVFRDEAWLKRQEASDLAVLHGVLADKGIRLLEALSTDEEEQGGDV